MAAGKSVNELCDFLKQELSVEVSESFFMHKIDGETFLQLNDEYLKELVPLLGNRLKVKRILTDALEESDGGNWSTAPTVASHSRKRAKEVSKWISVCNSQLGTSEPVNISSNSEEEVSFVIIHVQ